MAAGVPTTTLVFVVLFKTLFRVQLVFDANTVILWNNGDADSMAELSRKVGLTSNDLKYIFDNICTEFHDSLIIDKSRPYAKLRRNLFEVIPYHKR